MRLMKKESKRPKKVEAILRLKLPENTIELKAFLGAIHFKAKLSANLLERTDQLRKLLKKTTIDMGRRTAKRLRKKTC